MNVYPDTACIYDMVEGTVDSGPLEYALSEGSVSLVLSRQHVWEFIRRGKSEAIVVASFVDKLIGLGETQWARNLHPVANDELEQQVQNFLGNSYEFPPVLNPSFVDTLSWPEDKKAEKRGATVEEIVQFFLEEEHRTTHQKLTTDAADENRTYIEEARGFNKRIWEDPASFIVELHSGVPEIERFAAEFDWDSAPAFATARAYLDGQQASNTKLTTSDPQDYGHLIGVAYCDVAFVDKRTHEALRKGKAPKMPKKVGEFKGWVEGLNDE